MKTFKFSLVLRTRENTDVFISLDDNIYGIHSKRINILYLKPWRCIDVKATLYKRNVSAWGVLLKWHKGESFSGLKVWTGGVWSFSIHKKWKQNKNRERKQMLRLCRVNKWTQELIQSDPHQVLNIQRKDRQIQSNLNGSNLWDHENLFEIWVVRAIEG